MAINKVTLELMAIEIKAKKSAVCAMFRNEKTQCLQEIAKTLLYTFK